MRLAILSSHPIQYYAPLFRRIAKAVDLQVFFAHRATPDQQARAGFGTAFDWDVDLTSGYAHTVLRNVSENPGTGHFKGCDTPEIGSRLARGGFDALMVMGWHLKSYVQGVLAAKRLGIPVMVRGDSQLGTPRSRLKRTAKAVLYPPILRAFDAALPVGTLSKAYYRRYSYPERRLFLSPHCVDNDWFAERATAEARQSLRRALGIAQDRIVVLFCGRLLALKRPEDLVRALAICKSHGLMADLLVAGDGPLRDALHAQARELGVGLHAMGFVNQSGMPAAYAAGDMLVLPSQHETWGLVANEALASGRPVIVSDACGCAPDLADDGEAGRSFPVGDPHALAAAIAAVASRPPSAAVIARTVKTFSPDAATAGVTDALAFLAARRSRGSR